MSTITTSATGEAHSQPDLVIVEFSVVEKRDDANSARVALAERVADLRTAVDDLYDAVDQVRATRYSIEEGPRRGDDRDSPTFHATQQFAIEITDLASAGEVIDTATAHGANRVRGVKHTFSRSKRRELRHEALEDAMDTAREQADVIAGRADLGVTGVDSVETGGGNGARRRTERGGRWVG